MSTGRHTAPDAVDRIEGMLSELYEHQALLLIGLVTSRRLPDSLIWDLARILDASLRRTRRLLDGCREANLGAFSRGGTAPHPAIGEFLRRLRHRQSSARNGASV